MALTKADRRSIEYALRNAERALAYLRGDRVAVCVRKPVATTTLDYTRQDGAVLYEIDKAHGSDLVGIDNAIAELAAILATKAPR